MPKDAFPSTLQSWIGRKLLEGHEARMDVNRHIMQVYAQPLRVYYSGRCDRWLGDPADVVAGFLADRLGRPEFLENWEKSGLPLRRWLMNALGFYLAELRRQRRRDGRTMPVSEEEEAESPDPETTIDRAFAVSVVREALRRARLDCVQKGLETHWGIFLRHNYDLTPYDQVALDCGITQARAAVMARTAGKRFRAALREILAKDRAGEVNVDQEIRSLMEVLSQ